MAGPVDAAKQGLAELYKSGDFTDFEILCGPHTFKVHKAVICAQSKYFRLPCGKDCTEGTHRRIVLKAIGEADGEDGHGDDDGCDDAEAIKLVVEFFYHLDYPSEEANLAVPLDKTDVAMPPAAENVFVPDPWRNGSRGTKKLRKSNVSLQPPPQPLAAPSPFSDKNVVLHARVFAAAVKYQVVALQELAAAKFATSAGSSWNHPAFAEATRIAYTTTPDDFRQLRDTVCNIIHAYQTLLDKANIESVVKATPELHFELLRLARGLPAVAGAAEAKETE